MKRREIIGLSVLVTAVLLSLAPVLFAEVETRRVLSFTEYDLRVRAYAPYQADPGDIIEVRVTGEALEDLDNIDIDIDIFGSKSDAEGRVGYDSWDDDIRFLSGVDWDEGDDKDRDYDIEIPSDSDPGLVYGHVTAEWTTRADGKDHTYAESFIITYIINEDYGNIKDLLSDHGYAENETGLEDLLDDYDAAVSERDELKTDYTSLKSDYDAAVSERDAAISERDAAVIERDKLKADYSKLSGDYSDLEGRFSSLDSEHKSLLGDYDALESEHELTAGELSNYTTYTYALAVATVVFVVTTIIFAVRKPRSV